MRADLTGPCSNCPFRSDKPFPLRRAGDIARACLEGKSFTCHKTVDYSAGAGRDTPDSQWCGGALVFVAKNDALWNSTGLRVLAMSGVFAPDKLNLDAPVYDTVEDMVEGCAE